MKSIRETRCSFFIIFILFVLRISRIRGQEVLFRVDNQLRVGMDELVMECNPDNSGVGFDNVESITIAKKVTADNGMTKFDDFAGWGANGEMPINDSSLRGRIVTYDGKVGDPVSSFLRVIVGKTDCTDIGFYRCMIRSVRTSLQRTIQVTAIVAPGGVSSLMASPSNADGGVSSANLPHNATITGSGSYIVGTSIYLACQINPGTPATTSATLCYKLSSERAYRPLDVTPAVITTYGDTVQTQCVISQFYAMTYIVRQGDLVGRQFYCAVNSSGVCNTSPMSGQPTFNLSAVRLPDINTDCPVTPNNNISTTTTTTTTTPASTTPEPLMIDGDLLKLQTATNEVGIAFLVIGIILTGFSIPTLLVGVICYMRAKKLKKDMELQLTRTTYDALNFPQRATDGMTYESIGSEKSPAARQDSAGYMVPAEFTS